MNNKRSILKGCLCGISISLIIDATIILFFFTDMTAFLLYLVAFISGLSTLLLLITNNIKSILLSLLFSVLSFITAEIVITSLGIIRMFFQLKHGADAEMWAGDGFGMMVVMIYCLAGSAIGTIGAFIVTLIRNNKLNKLS